MKSEYKEKSLFFLSFFFNGLLHVTGNSKVLFYVEHKFLNKSTNSGVSHAKSTSQISSVMTSALVNAKLHNTADRR